MKMNKVRCSLFIQFHPKSRQLWPNVKTLDLTVFWLHLLGCHIIIKPEKSVLPSLPREKNNGYWKEDCSKDATQAASL